MGVCLPVAVHTGMLLEVDRSVLGWGFERVLEARGAVVVVLEVVELVVAACGRVAVEDD